MVGVGNCTDYSRQLYGLNPRPWCCDSERSSSTRPVALNLKSTNVVVKLDSGDSSSLVCRWPITAEFRVQRISPTCTLVAKIWPKIYRQDRLKLLTTTAVTRGNSSSGSCTRGPKRDIRLLWILGWVPIISFYDTVLPIVEELVEIIAILGRVCFYSPVGTDRHIAIVHVTDVRWRAEKC